MSIQYTTDLSIPYSTLNVGQKIVREFYLVSAKKIWGVKPEDSLPEDEESQLFNRLFAQWKGWLNENFFDTTRLGRVKRLTNQIEKTKYETNPADNRLKQVWKHFLQTFGTQERENDLEKKTVDQIRDLAVNHYDSRKPQIYGYEGGALPVGLLTDSPYLKNLNERNKNIAIEKDGASIWREMRFMEQFINIDANGQTATRETAANQQETTWRWIRGESEIWNRTNVHYWGWIGRDPRDITSEVDYDGLLEQMGMQVFVGAHRLACGAEVLSIAALPKDPGENTKVSIQIPSRWGMSQISTPQDMFRFLEGTCKESQGVIIYGRRLQFGAAGPDFRPDESKYQQSVNPAHEAFHIYDNLLTADTSEFTEEVLRVYGEMKDTRLEADFIWATEMGTWRLVADLARDQENHSPFVLMSPTAQMDPLSAHWSYLGPWMGVDVDYKGELVDQVNEQLAAHTEESQCILDRVALKEVRETLDRIKAYEPYSRKDVEEATNLLDNAKKLPEVKGRKVLILMEPKFPYFPGRMNDGQYRELHEILLHKGYNVTMVQPQYTPQKDGYRYYPNLGDNPDAKKWFENL